MESQTSTATQPSARYTIEICQSGAPLYPDEPSRLGKTIRDAGACLEATLESTDRLFLKPGSSFPYLRYLLTDYSRCVTIYLVRDEHTKTLEGWLITRGEGPGFQPQYDGEAEELEQGRLQALAEQMVPGISESRRAIWRSELVRRLKQQTDSESQAGDYDSAALIITCAIQQPEPEYSAISQMFFDALDPKCSYVCEAWDYEAAPYIRRGFESIAECNVPPPEGTEDIKLMILLKSPTATGSENGDTAASEASSWEDLGEHHA